MRSRVRDVSSVARVSRSRIPPATTAFVARSTRLYRRASPPRGSGRLLIEKPASFACRRSSVRSSGGGAATARVAGSADPVGRDGPPATSARPRTLTERSRALRSTFRAISQPRRRAVAAPSRGRNRRLIAPAINVRLVPLARPIRLRSPRGAMSLLEAAGGRRWDKIRRSDKIPSQRPDGRSGQGNRPSGVPASSWRRHRRSGRVVARTRWVRRRRGGLGPTPTAARNGASRSGSGPPDPVTPPGERCALPEGPTGRTVRSYYRYASPAGFGAQPQLPAA